MWLRKDNQFINMEHVRAFELSGSDIKLILDAEALLEFDNEHEAEEALNRIHGAICSGYDVLKLDKERG